MPDAAPPLAPRRPKVLSAHGDDRIDDWHWLRDRDDPAVLAYLEAENAYTRAMTAHREVHRDALYDEMVARIQETDLSVPVQKGPWRYYVRTEAGRQYAIHCRRPAGGSEPGDAKGDEGVPADEQILLDENQAAEGHDFFALGVLAVSPDHQLLAYSVDTTGAERYTVRVRELSTGTDLADVVEDTYYGLAWANDNATVFYTRPDSAMRPHQLWRHRLGQPAADDTCVHTEPDEHFYLGVTRTKDDALILMELSSKVTSEVWMLPAHDPDGQLKVVEPRRHGVEYGIDHVGHQLLIVTNDGAENFRLMTAPDTSPGRDSWDEALPYDPAVRLDGIEVAAHHLVLYERAGGYRRIRVVDHEPDQAGPWPDPVIVEQPEEVSTAWGGANPEMDSPTLRYEYTSLVTPRSVYDYDLRSGQATLLKRQAVLGGYDPGAYRSERLWAENEGRKIPVSVVYPVGTERDGSAPCLLYGYGAYEASMDPAFSSLRLSLLERGFVFAIAHVRGGGELGRRWYEEGKLEAKSNSFSDFVACARHLVDQGWTSPSRLVARGGSAGGLLMGAVANLAPECFAAIVAEVPFVDCLTTILDESLPLTVMEWEEWGNPGADPAIYAAMKAYSPYDNVGSHPYPRLLVTAGLNDPRVGYWEPAKWVAKIRALSASTTVLLKTELGAGHQGPSGRYDAWRDEAFVVDFILESAQAPAGVAA